MSKNPYLIDLSSDFGFTATNEDELPQVQQSVEVTQTLVTTNQDLRNRLEAVQKIFLPLLESLMKDPEKPFIKWPNRKEVVEKQIKKLIQLTTLRL